MSSQEEDKKKKKRFICVCKNIQRVLWAMVCVINEILFYVYVYT